MNLSQKQFSTILDSQQEIISKIALGSSLSECLESICLLIESTLNSPSARSSILILEGDQLRHGAAPNLPNDYCDAVDGVKIGPEVGSCGTAVFEQKQTIVEDIENHPLWKEYKHIALSSGLKACWSNPIFASDNTILGSFAIYYLEPKSPDKLHLELIDYFTHLSSIAIEKARSTKREQLLTSKLKYSNEKFSAFTSVMPDLALIVSEDGTYIDSYGAEHQVYKDKLIGKNIREVLLKEHYRKAKDVIKKAIKNNRVEIFEYKQPTENGLSIFEGRVSLIDHYLANSPDKKHVLWMARDITDRKHAEHKIEQLAYFDPLTSLPNRRFLKQQLHKLIEQVQKENVIGAVLYLDLDNFKRINDSLGHSVGDKVLIEVAERLKLTLNKNDTISRIGGDEFVIILKKEGKQKNNLSEESIFIANKIISNLSENIKIINRNFKIGASIGISLVYGPKITVDEILKRADTAMYSSKNSGGNQFTFFDPTLQHTIDYRLDLEQKLVIAIKKEQLSIHFQPQLGLNSELIGAEALIRWPNSEQRPIPPSEFIPIAEQCSLIEDILIIVLKEACKLLNQLKQENLIDKNFSIALNLSPTQFRQEDLKLKLLETITEYGIKANQIKLEITESMLIDSIDTAIKQMNDLKQQGFNFSIDDFGTGYSSLTYLQTLPIDELKIDRSFIEKINSGEVGTAIIDAIIAMSNHIGFEVIAEGVQDQYQVDTLRTKNIKAMQGFYISKPMPKNIFSHWAKKQKAKNITVTKKSNCYETVVI